MITAKVICQSKQESGEGEDRTVTVTFGADYADERNKEWARWTPVLSLTMGLRGSVADKFETSKAYTLRFVESDDQPDS
jgi:hypothetical protein